MIGWFSLGLTILTILVLDLSGTTSPDYIEGGVKREYWGEKHYQARRYFLAELPTG